jgi:hypothetical protein
VRSSDLTDAERLRSFVGSIDASCGEIRLRASAVVARFSVLRMMRYAKRRGQIQLRTYATGTAQRIQAASLGRNDKST